MGLLDKIHTKLDAPVPEPVPVPAPMVEDNVLDMDLRDAFIRDVMAVPDNALAQLQLWAHYRATGTNLITLRAAVKMICSNSQASLIDTYGRGEVLLQTAQQWKDNSNYAKLYK